MCLCIAVKLFNRFAFRDAVVESFTARDAAGTLTID